MPCYHAFTHKNIPQLQPKDPTSALLQPNIYIQTDPASESIQFILTTESMMDEECVNMSFDMRNKGNHFLIPELSKEYWLTFELSHLSHE
ncbi:hypothetical protein CHARACLAT_015239 [Characodon lateralis]|uniref:Uncharacterized protein n=1 Tax=Characodon lateralis TaxID=208331 RepID=A0ABU7E9W5_9TELE|nr:hypothetical protein [Characodon lateralis]